MKSPREFYRERHPDEFSDSRTEKVSEFDRDVIDHALTSITTNNQEQAFERFCLRVCEARICPNLIPNTGPAGGGDGKVDADTFPVADSLSYFEGIGRNATKERWAFAVSAKRKWKEKVKADVRSILSTGRPYARIIFVTNQAVPGRERQVMQDQLEAAHNVPIVVLDRTWLLDSIIYHSCAKFAVDELSIKSAQKFNVLPGPRDERRRKRLNELVADLQECSEGSQSFLSVENALLAAQLARSLEEPRAVVESFFEQAREFAAKQGTDSQRIEVEYQLAWTLFWWQEDFAGFLKSYDRFIKNIGPQPTFDALSKWRNLWNIAPVALEATKSPARLRKTKELGAAVDASLANLSVGSTAELNLRFLKLELAVYAALNRRQVPSATFSAMALALPGAANHLGFRFEGFIEWIDALAEILPSDPDFEKLYDLAADLQATRDSEITAAKMQLDRAEALIKLDHSKEAVVRLSRAHGHLLKHETRSECIQCLFLLGNMYFRLGLTWAARATFLAASAIGLQYLDSDDKLHPALIVCLGYLRVCSITLGLVGESLAWHELTRLIHSITYQRTGEYRIIPEEETKFEILLGRLILRVPNDARAGLNALPAVLDQLDLPIASDLARIKLGAELSIVDYMPKPPRGTALDAVYHLQVDMKLADVAVDVPAEPRSLSTTLYGCRFEFEFENPEESRHFAEVLLTLIEPIFATATVGEVFALQERVVVRLVLDENAGTEIELDRLNSDPHADFSIRFGTGVSQALTNAPDAISPKLVECALLIAFGSFMSKAALEKIESKADANLFERCQSISRCISDLNYVVGDLESLKLEPRLEKCSEQYPITEAKWIPNPSAAKPTRKHAKGKKVTTEDEFRKSLSSLGHSQVSVVSPIRAALWDAAGWFGVMFAWSPYDQQPPVMALGFENAEAGRAILDGWKQTYGNNLAEHLRISIVRGISKKNPYHYRLLVSGQIPTTPSDEKRFVQSVARIHTMQATTPENLQGFLDMLAYHRQFILTCTGRELPTQQAWADLLKGGVALREVVIRQAWEIGRHDLDMAGVQPDDDVEIPEGVENPPVLELLNWYRDRVRKHGS